MKNYKIEYDLETHEVVDNTLVQKMEHNTLEVPEVIFKQVIPLLVSHSFIKNIKVEEV